MSQALRHPRHQEQQYRHQELEQAIRPHLDLGQDQPKSRSRRPGKRNEAAAKVVGVAKAVNHLPSPTLTTLKRSVDEEREGIIKRGRYQGMAEAVIGATRVIEATTTPLETVQETRARGVIERVRGEMTVGPDPGLHHVHLRALDPDQGKANPHPPSDSKSYGIVGFVIVHI